MNGQVRLDGRSAMGGGFALLEVPVAARAAFLDLAHALEPDSLACDGMAGPGHVAEAVRAIGRKWGELQRRHGVALTAQDAVAAYGGDRETLRAIARARLGNLSPDVEAEVEEMAALHTLEHGAQPPKP